MMNTVTISLTDAQWKKLQDKAQRMGIAPEMLLVATLEDLLVRPEEDFRRTVEYVVQKNAELYRRLSTGA